MSAPPPCRLYLVTPPAFDLAAFADALEAALDAGDVASVQLRLKGASDVDVLRAAERLLPLCAPRDVAFIVNDRPDLALAAGADGVHIGQEDAPFDEARRILGLGRIVGVTCHDSRHLAVEAADAGADYVAFGAFFPTATKEAKGHPEPELLAWWSDIMTVPCVAIGGIDAANCAPLVAAGADFLAVSSGVWAHPQGPAEGVRALNAAIAKAAEERPR